MNDEQIFAAFLGDRLVARGTVETLVERLHPISSESQADLRLFDEATGKAVDFDWRGKSDEVLARARMQLAHKGKGRPKLGVQSREITLLPRHWNWLDAQGRSASATLRTMVEKAMGQAPQTRDNIDAIYWQMSALAGDLPGFEEAARRLYAFDWDEAERIFQGWPGDLSGYFVQRLNAAVGRGKEPS